MKVEPLGLEEADGRTVWEAAIGVTDQGKSAVWTESNLVPVSITLRDFAREEFEPGSPLAIWQHVAARLEKVGFSDAVEPLRRHALAGRVLFLLDGVDEVPLAQRREVWRVIAAMDKGFCGRNRWVATCRVLSSAP